MSDQLQEPTSSTTRHSSTAVLVAYCLTLTVLQGASFLPEYRVWAFNNWAYFPSWVPVGLLGVGVLLPVVVWPISSRLTFPDNGGEEHAKGAGRPWLALVVVLLLCGLFFYLLRPDTFFLGDGYTVISLLARDVPLVKLRDLGEGLAHMGVKQLFGLSGEAGAVKTFQLISIAAGLGFMAAIFRLGAALYSRRTERALFALIVASSGPALLFFGYVENYSIFVLSVTVYVLFGLLVAQGKARWPWLVLLAAVSCFLHIFGVVLLPSLLYLLVSSTPVGMRLRALPSVVKRIVTGAVVVASVGLFVHYYAESLYFRFAIVPLWPGPHVVDGYWLLSFDHLVDLVNLVFLMLPSAAVVAVCLFASPSRRWWGGRDYRYLLVLSLSAAGAAFIFDPRLGMPRDWDLFAFCGIPWAVTAAYFLLNHRYRGPHHVRSVILVIALGLLVLLPRVVGQTVPEIAIARFNNYAALDRAKNMYGRTLLVKYYQNLGDSAAVAREAERYRNDYPERYINQEGVAFQDEGDCRQAIARFSRAIEMNPLFSAAYANMGMCLQEVGRLDSALQLFSVSAALNPYNAAIATKQAGAYFALADYDEAERLLRWAVRIDPANLDAHLGLLQIYRLQGRREERLTTLRDLVELPGAPPDVIEELVGVLVQRGELDEAAAALDTAVGRGLDSRAVEQILQRHPRLKAVFQVR